MPHNNALRRRVYGVLVDEGWADRVSEQKFRLLVAPAHLGEGAAASGTLGTVDCADPLDDPEDEGFRVEAVRTGSLADDTGHIALGAVAWSGWTSLADAARTATRSPGVYRAKVGSNIVYAGMTGERRGRGVRGRLTVYARGRGAVSGLGEAVLDRALADPDWLTARLHDLRVNGPSSAKEWAAAAFSRESLDVAWSATDGAKAAKELEHQILVELADVALWNRARPHR